MKVTRFQCLGRTKKGQRCRNMFLTNPYSKALVCSTHSDQKPEIQLSPISVKAMGVDVAKIIASLLDDPTTFANWARTCKSAANACHRLQEDKKKQFAKREVYGLGTILVLPNGDYLTKEDVSL